MTSTSEARTARGAVRTPRTAPLTDPVLGLVDGHLHRGPGVAPVLRTAVDVGAYTREDHAKLPVDAPAVEAEGLPGDGTARTLGVLQRTEGSALAESRAMLATWTGNEARITAFLATWHVARHWQARALRDLLTAAGPARRPVPEAGADLLGRLRRIHVDRVQPLLSPAWTVLAGEAVTAGHMARLAIQEASLRTALRALAPRLGPEAARVVTEVADRHDDAVAFFRAEALARLTRSRREAAVARLVLSLDSPWHGGGVPDPDLPAALADLGADPRVRADLRRDREDITRLLPGPGIPLLPGALPRARPPRRASPPPTPPIGA